MRETRGSPSSGSAPAPWCAARSHTTVLLVGPALASAREALAERIGAMPLSPRAGQVCSASPLGTDGLLLRAASTSAEVLLRTAREWLSFLPPLLGDDPWTRRA
ncbi:hypothetical protein JY651_09720 [Pyxidicoccus parkwayensis]|uniref:Urease accessory protein UreD n=1 Tax=Pyxidicoccus parkwayensis TaxID=2813578 RepID=A0ABX7P420_9BACT|nr:hypothetical protein [Pyxidicoccus parkwaysis]QSQ25181.1 hypothetical protein JY651_09720 [Pyxidicoccus parkwaysis]